MNSGHQRGNSLSGRNATASGVDNGNHHRRFDDYVYEYLVRRNLLTTAEIFQQEAQIAEIPGLTGSSDSFLYDWWTLFCEVFMSRQNAVPAQQPAFQQAIHTQSQAAQVALSAELYDQAPLPGLFDEQQASMQPVSGVVPPYWQTLSGFGMDGQGQVPLPLVPSLQLQGGVDYRSTPNAFVLTPGNVNSPNAAQFVHSRLGRRSRRVFTINDPIDVEAAMMPPTSTPRGRPRINPVARGSCTEANIRPLTGIMPPPGLISSAAAGFAGQTAHSVTLPYSTYQVHSASPLATTVQSRGTNVNVVPSMLGQLASYGTPPTFQAKSASTSADPSNAQKLASSVMMPPSSSSLLDYYAKGNFVPSSNDNAFPMNSDTLRISSTTSSIPINTPTQDISSKESSVAINTPTQGMSFRESSIAINTLTQGMLAIESSVAISSSTQVTSATENSVAAALTSGPPSIVAMISQLTEGPSMPQTDAGTHKQVMDPNMQDCTKVGGEQMEDKNVGHCLNDDPKEPCTNSAPAAPEPQPEKPQLKPSGLIQIRDEEVGFEFKQEGCLEATSSELWCCHFSTSGKYLACAGIDKKIMVWNMEKFACAISAEHHDEPIADIRFKPNSLIFATASLDRTIRIWDATKPEKALFRLNGHVAKVTSVDFHPAQPDVLCSCDGDKEVRLWNLSSRACLTAFKGGSQQVRFQPGKGKYLAVAAGNTINILDGETGNNLHTLLKHIRPVKCICWDTSGKFLASVSQESAYIWSVSNWPSSTHQLTAEGGREFRSCIFHPAISQVVLIGGNKNIEIWNPTTQNSKTILVPAHKSYISGLASSLKTDIIASASHDSCVKLWR